MKRHPRRQRIVFLSRLVGLFSWALLAADAFAATDDPQQGLETLRQELRQKEAVIRQLREQVARLERLPAIEASAVAADLGFETGATGDDRFCPPPACRCDAGGPLDNLSLFLGLEGSKQPQDFGVNAHLGGRFDANLGLALSTSWGLGLQLGTSLNMTDNAVQVLEAVGSKKGRLQSFTTVGLFQRTQRGLVWGLAYDFLYQDYLDDSELGQWRGKFGWQLSDRSEVGARLMLSQRSAAGTVSTALGGIPIVLDPITQGSLYFRRSWESGAETTVWLGIAEGHTEANLAFPVLGIAEFESKDEPFFFGAEIHIPLNDRLALFGQGNFVGPADTGTVDSYLGFVFYPRGGAARGRQRRFAPLLPVANNTSFAVDLSRR